MTNSSPQVFERVKWHLLADATTDFFSLPEAILYGASLLETDNRTQKAEEAVVRLLQELLDEGLIEFFIQDAFASPDAREAMRKLLTEEARARLTERRWRYAEIEPDGLSLWYSSTPKGEASFSALSPSQVDDLFQRAPHQSGGCGSPA